MKKIRVLVLSSILFTILAFASENSSEPELKQKSVSLSEDASYNGTYWATAQIRYPNTNSYGPGCSGRGCSESDAEKQAKKRTQKAYGENVIIIGYTTKKTTGKCR